MTNAREPEGPRAFLLRVVHPNQCACYSCFIVVKKQTRSRKRVARRALPLRRVTVRVPDTRLSSVRRELRRQARLMARHDATSDVDEFIEKLYVDNDAP